MQRHRLTRFLLLGLLTALASPATAQTSAAAQPSADQVIDRITQAETELIERVRGYRPIVEAYIQEIAPEKDGLQLPMFDSYFLGRLEWQEGPVLALMANAKRVGKSAGERRGFLPDGFASMAAPDWKSMDRARYDFKLVRREFLGEVRTMVFDVVPRQGPNAGFSGRIWVEDRGYNIVRYNGVNRNVKGPRFRKKVYLHVDGWRVNSGSGLWLPAYIHCEETGLDGSDKGGLVRSQVKLWGYNTTKGDETQQFTSIQIAEANVQDATDQTQLTPVASQRRWEQEAEMNVVERLERAGLLAPAGEVERVLDTVLNNLQATNDLALERPVRARVLLTSPLESFTVGHTLVLSRGFIDVLPDEASLAMALAHELSHVVLGHRLIDTKFAFADRMMIGDAELLSTIAMRREASEEAAADAKVVEMLDRSPYKDKLASAGLFLRIVAERSKTLPELIQPHVGDHVSGKEAQRLSELMTRAPELKHQDLTQVPALPIGARLVVDPWDGRLELLRSAAALPSAIREKTPLAITPLTPHLKYPAGTALPVQPRALPRAANPAAAPVATATEAVVPTVPTLRDVEIAAPPTSAPQVPQLAPVPDLTLPENGPSVPGLKVVPDIGPLPSLTPVAPAIREVPSVAPEPDLCAIEGTDLACGPKVPR
jgi:hypothetical protein